MNICVEDELIEIGLSRNEAKTYLAIAELGLTSIGNVAKKSKIHRTNVYDAVEGLVKKGIVSYITKDNVKFYQIDEPANFLNLLREKEEKIKSILPKLHLLTQLSANENQAQIFEGLPAAKRAMDNFLTHNDTIMVMGVSKNVAELIGPFLTQYHQRRMEKKIVMKHIYNSDAHARIKTLASMKYTEVRVLPSEYDSPVATNIVGDEVTMIYWDKNALVIRITNKNIADVYRKYFELLWRDAKPVKPEVQARKDS